MMGLLLLASETCGEFFLMNDVHTCVRDTYQTAGGE